MSLSVTMKTNIKVLLLFFFLNNRSCSNSKIKFYYEEKGFFFNFRVRRKHGKIDIINVAYIFKTFALEK